MTTLKSASEKRDEEIQRRFTTLRNPNNDIRNRLAAFDWLLEIDDLPKAELASRDRYGVEMIRAVREAGEIRVNGLVYTVAGKKLGRRLG